MKNLTYNGTVPQHITYKGTPVRTVTYNGVTVWQAETVLDALTSPRCNTSTPNQAVYSNAVTSPVFEASIGDTVRLTAYVHIQVTHIGEHNMGGALCFRLYKIVDGVETVVVDRWSYNIYGGGSSLVNTAINAGSRDNSAEYSYTFAEGGTYRIAIRTAAMRAAIDAAAEGYTEAWTSEITIS